jgi:hypothetical protein
MSKLTNKSNSSIIARNIRSSLLEKCVIRIHRRGLDYVGAHTDGIVVAQSTRLLLLNIMDPAIILDGYAIIFLSDITDASVCYDNAEFINMALRLRHQKPFCPKDFRLENLNDAIISASTHAPLITLRRERMHRDSCWIGRVQSIGDKLLTIKSISPAAKFEEDEVYRLCDLTKVEFGGRYEDALHSVATSHRRGGRKVKVVPTPAWASERPILTKYHYSKENGVSDRSSSMNILCSS